MALLPAEAHYLAYGHAINAKLVQGVFNLIELEGLDYRLNLLQTSTSSKWTTHHQKA